MNAYTELRAIDMYRAFRATRMPAIPEDDSWLTIGHFDRFKIMRLNAEDTTSTDLDLTLIQDHNKMLSAQEAEMYIQPLYILKEFSVCDREKVEGFWEMPSAFLLVTRVHANIVKQKKFEDDLTTCLDAKPVPGSDPNADKEPTIVSYLSDDKADVRYILYRTLELSNNILIAKSDSIEALFKTVGRLYYLSCVGDVYSYFGVSSAELQAKPGNARTDDVISRALMRFSVKAAKKSREYFDIFRGRGAGGLDDRVGDPLFVNGTEDLMVIAEKLNSRELCAMLRSLLLSGDLAGGPVFWDAFHDMTTRLSIGERQLMQPKQDSPGEELTLYNEYSALYHRFHKSIYGSGLKDHPDWVRPVEELIKSMQTISRDCTLRQVCYVVLDGIYALVWLSEDIIRDLQDAKGKKDLRRQNLTGQKVKMLQSAFAGISDLMEHMIRMEGELVHHPETRPLLYDIPANLLELYLHFSDLCLRYYQNREIPEDRREGHGRFRLLLLPCLCEDIKVYAINGLNNKDQCFLYVELPLHVLYDSKYAICSLVHEVAHFGGETTRARGYRYAAMRLAVAAVISAATGKKVTRDTIERAIDASIPQSAESRQYMDSLYPTLLNAASKICEDSKLVGNIDENTWYAIQRSINELRVLVREAYADLAMVSLLELTAEDYISMLERDLRCVTQATSVTAVERAALVIRAVWPDDWKSQFSTVDEFSKDIKACLQWITTDKPASGLFRGGYHHHDALGALYSYLSQCRSIMRDFDEQPQNCDQIDNIRRRFQSFAIQQRFASSDFYYALEKHRADLLGLDLEGRARAYEGGEPALTPDR